MNRFFKIGVTALLISVQTYAGTAEYGKVRKQVAGIADYWEARELYSGTANYREALKLFDLGLYESVWNLLKDEQGELPEGYRAICAFRLKMEQAESGAINYLGNYPKSTLAPVLRFELGNQAFYKAEYAKAYEWYTQITEKSLPQEIRIQYIFNKSFCQYDAENFAEAVKGFAEVEKQSSDYRTPSRYYLGYIAYCSRDPQTAAGWFEQTKYDPRFAQLSEYYLLECRFLMKDYDYVLQTGESLALSLPSGARPSVYRILSEACLVKGDSAKAAEFLELEELEGRMMSRLDYFHAGSVLFAVKNYKRAAENFSKMSERTDSLGQIANYQLGYACVKTGNKVAALEAFNDAARLDFDQNIKEDACFNYAKLAFDLNHDPAGFQAYLNAFSTTSKGDAIYGYMALSELYSKDYAAAVEYYGKIDELDRMQKANYMKANYLRAKQLFDSGSYSDAIPCLKMASYYLSKYDRFSQMSKFQLGEAYFKAGNYPLAQTTWTELYNLSALSRTPQGNALPYDIAYSYFMQENFVSAARWFDNYIASSDKTFRTDAMMRRADCDYYRRDYSAALTSCQAAINACNSVYPIYLKGVCYGLLGKKKDKQQTLLQAVSKPSSDPWYPEALHELAKSCLDLGYNADAIKYFDKLKALDSSDKENYARALLGKGTAYRNLGQYDLALEQFKKLIAEMPDSEQAQDALPAIESIYQAQHHPEMYLHYVESLKLVSDKNPEEKSNMYFSTAEQLYLAGSYQQAEEYLTKYLEKCPGHSKNGEAMFYLADSQKAQGKKELSLESFGKAIEMLEDGSFKEQARINVASINFSLQRYDKAYDAWSELHLTARIDQNKAMAANGMMQSAFKAKRYVDVISASQLVGGREAELLKAKSLLALSKREAALATFRELAKDPADAVGAESKVVLIQDCYESGKFDAVPEMVFDFARKCKTESYWLAKAYLILGDSYAEKGNFTQAKATFESIKNGYTGDDEILPGVQMRLDKIKEMNK